MSQRDSLVLVVDDEPSNRLIYRKILAQIPGVQVVEAASGGEALAIIEEKEADLVLLDIMMPGMDGFEVAREIRLRNKGAAPPLVFITAFDPSEQSKVRGFAEGGQDFFSKPLDLELLKRKVGALLNLQRQKAEVAERLAELGRERREVDALLAAAKDVMANRDFPSAARKVFDRCKETIGARAGCVALLAKGGKENEVLFLDPGGMPCSVDPEMPMPIRDLRQVAYAERRTVRANDFMRGPRLEFMPEGHAELENVLFAPLVIDNQAVGLLGLANKPGGFGQDDERVAGAFGELAALALRNAQTLDSLNRANRLMAQAGAMSRLGSFEWDAASGEMFWTEGLCATLGLDRRPEAPCLGDFLACIHEQDRGQVRAALDRVLAGGPMAETEFRGSGGMDAHVFQIQARSLAGHGREKAVIGACQDISAIKEMEARAMHVQRLDSIGQLAAGLAHEINTPLQYMAGNLDFIRAAFAKALHCRGAGGEEAGRPGPKAALPGELGRDFEEAIRDCNEGLQRIQAIVKSLLRFSRSETQGQACCNVNTLAGDVASLSRNVWEEVADIRFDLDQDMPEMVCIPGEIGNCLLNLVMNAAEAIRAKPRAPGEKGTITLGSRREDRWLHLWVADTGTGIPRAIRSKVFNPFFTTREVGQGVGMGLALAHAAVRAHGGELSFETAEGQGSAFHIRLPLEKE